MVSGPEVVQKDGSYALTLEFAAGIVDSDVLNTVNDVVKEEGARIHLTTSQKIMILDLTKGSVERTRKKLQDVRAEFKIPKRFYQPRVCVGSKYCTLGLRDTLSLANQISQRYAGMDIPYKLKIGISGCMASCAHSTLSDIGLIARKSGYSFYVGGKVGTNPQCGKLVEEKLPNSQAIDMLGKTIAFYQESYEGKKKRLIDIIEKVGFEKFKDLVHSAL